MARNLTHNSSIEACQPIEEQRGIAPVLVRGEAADAFLDDVEARRREALPGAFGQVLDTLRGGGTLAMLAHRLLEFAARMAAAEGEGGEIGIDRLASFADRRLEGLIRD